MGFHISTAAAEAMFQVSNEANNQRVLPTKPHQPTHLTNHAPKSHHTTVRAVPTVKGLIATPLEFEEFPFLGFEFTGFVSWAVAVRPQCWDKKVWRLGGGRRPFAGLRSLL